MTFEEKQIEMNSRISGKLEEMKRELLFTNLGDLNDVSGYKNAVINLLDMYYYSQFDSLDLFKLKCDLRFRDYNDLIDDRIYKIDLSYRNSLRH